MFHSSPALKSELGQVDPNLILTSVKNNVATLTMNDPKKLNGWTGPMMLTLRHLFVKHAKDEKTKVILMLKRLNVWGVPVRYLEQVSCQGGIKIIKLFSWFTLFHV